MSFEKGHVRAKQGSRCWNVMLSSTLKALGFQQLTADQCIYCKKDGKTISIIAVYVDDLLLFYDDKTDRDKIVKQLQNKFKVKDLGEATHCLGMRITRDRKEGELWIDQENYINKILSRFNMEDCKSVLTPMDPNQKLSKEMESKSAEEKEQMANVPYMEAIGSILYVSQVSRPDISYAVNFLSRFSKNPGKAHWSAVKRLLRCLKGTTNLKLQYRKGANSSLVGFCDADWGNDINDRHSVSGYVFVMQGSPISWGSKRQATVALSTTEAEYMSLSSTYQEALCLRNLA